MRGRNAGFRALSLLLALVMVVGLLPMNILAAEGNSSDAELTAALEEAKGYIDAITLDNTSNDPATVVSNFKTHFTWDNEKRESSKSYLFDWSYYNGVVFEGLEYVYEVTGESAYKDYVVEYMSTLIDANGNWATCSNNSSKEAAGYNATHGADCYMTASLLLDTYAMTCDDRYLTMAAKLYADLDTAAESYLLANAGNNFRHTWASDSTPDLWLDGLYMILPFRAEYAKHIGDTDELDLIVSRMQWVSDNMYDEETGLFYHAADSASSNSGTFWLRSIGWYAAAIVDIMDSMEGENLNAMKAQLVKLVDGMKNAQNATNGMWLNNMAAAESSTNPYETSGTALVCYAVLKAVNNGWLDESYADMAILAFKGICSEKLENNNLTDICFKGAPGSSNSTFYDNEGKGLGPFIMFYAEVLAYVNGRTSEPEVPETTVPEESTPAVPEQTVTNGETSFTVGGVSGQLVGAALTDEDKAMLDAEDYEDYIAMDVTGTVAEGETAVVTVEIPEGWNTGRIVGIHVENGAVVHIPGTVSDGKFTFEVTHFSATGIALLAETSVTGEGKLVTEYVYTLDTNGVTANKNYLIVNTGSDTTSGHALTNNNGSAGDTTVTISDGKITVEDDTDIAWVFSGSTSGTVGNNGWYVYPDDGSLSLNTSGTNMNINSRGNGAYRISRSSGRSTYYLRYNDGWTGGNSRNLYLYELTSSSAGDAVTFTITPGSATLQPGNTQDLTGTVTVAGEKVDLRDCTIVWASSNTAAATVSDGTVTAVADGTTNITATLSAVDGTALQKAITLTIPVTVSTKKLNAEEFEISVSPASVFMLPDGQTKQLTATVNWNGEEIALDRCTFSWNTDQTNIATIDKKGVITSAEEGEAKATFTLTHVDEYPLDEPITVDIPVTVQKTVSGVGQLPTGTITTYQLVEVPETGKKYIIVNSNVPGNGLTIGADKSTIAVEIDRSISTSGEDQFYVGATQDAIAWTATKVDDTWTFHDADGKYLGIIVIAAGDTGVVNLTTDAAEGFRTWILTEDSTLYFPFVYSQEIPHYLHANPEEGEWDLFTEYMHPDEPVEPVYFYGETTVESKGETVTFTIDPGAVRIKPDETSTLVGNVALSEGTVESTTIEWVSSNPDIVTVDEYGNITGVSDGTATVTATLKVVNGIPLVAPISLPVSVTVHTEGLLVRPMVGYVPKNNDGSTTEVTDANGETIMVTFGYENGTKETVPLTVGMLSGIEDAQLHTIGVYEDLTVTYTPENSKEAAVTGFVLHVVQNPGNNFPLYPEPGSIRTNKVIAESSRFQQTGVAEIQLSTSGVPVPGGVDVVIVADISNSMAWTLGDTWVDTNGNGSFTDDEKAAVGDETDKWDMLKASVAGFIDTLLWSDKSGNTVSFVTFGGYDAHRNANATNYSNYFDATDTVFTGYTNADDAINKINEYSIAYDTNSASNYYVTVGENKYEAQGGTNYDYAFLEAASAIRALKAQYAQNNNGASYDDSDRQIYVVFLTDGAPDHYNQLYYKTRGSDTFDYNALYRNSEDIAAGFDSYLTAAPTTTFASTYVWRQHTTNGYYMPYTGGTATMTAADWVTWIQSDSLKTAVGVKAISGVESIDVIGFDMDAGGFAGYSFTQEQIEPVLKNLAGENSSEVILATNQARIDEYFNGLASKIKEAATEAYFLDQLGDDFNLQMASKIVRNGTPYYLNPVPHIEISTYRIYKASDIGKTIDGIEVTPDMVGERCYKKYTQEDVSKMTYEVVVTRDMIGKTVQKSDGTAAFTITENHVGQSMTLFVSEDMVGMRYETPTIIETVTFNEDGTEAYSNLDVNGDGDTNDNIIVDGVIVGKNFWYNTNVTSSPITLADNTTATLDSEAFRWNIGTISDQEFVLSYYVYLDGANEGNVPAGSYKTNNYADLYYTNYLDNSVSTTILSPTVAWGAATVSYAFYLVNENGIPITNPNSSPIGLGSFYDAVKVTTPVVYQTIYLNTASIPASVVAEKVLPDGYKLFNGDAQYTVTVDSSSGSNSTNKWEISDTSDTTYVTNFYGNYATNKNSAEYAESDSFSYTNTVVWFAVRYDASTVPDVVVIDYGLPVDISVLANDLLNVTATIVGIGAIPDDFDATASHNSQLMSAEEYVGVYGRATINGDKIRYTPGDGLANSNNGDLIMDSYDRFAYEASYVRMTTEASVTTQETHYFYGSVTVIPATTVYYEDSFLNYRYEEWSDAAGGWVDYSGDAFKWTYAANSSATQDEDRPGQYSLPEIDADSLYGYDSSYKDVSEYSMNGYAKANVDYDHSAIAEFDFYGTGFDVISMTNNTTGTIFVDIYEHQADGNYSLDDAVHSFVVDTYYGYKRVFYEVTYSYNAETEEWEMSNETPVDELGTSETPSETPVNGQTYVAYETRWEVDNSESDSIYQVPVMKVAGLAYGKYHAEIVVQYDPFFDHGQYSNETYDFYLDAIRIYDPAGTTYDVTDENDNVTEDGNIADVIQGAYIADGEGWPMYEELRDNILSKNSFDGVANGLLDDDKKMTGLVFIDGDEIVGNAQMEDYKNFGPNNELYLAPGQDVAFILNLDDYCNFTVEKDSGGNIISKVETSTIVTSVQIGIKSATGETVDYIICNIGESGNYYAPARNTLNTSTDMYYNITSYRGDVIVISNAHEPTNPDDAGKILSITNIKVTFTQNPTDFTPTITEVQNTTSERMETVNTVNMQVKAASSNAVQPMTDGTGEEEIGLFYMTYEATQRTLQALNNRAAEKEPEVEETVPEETVPETTAPEETVPETTVPETTVPETTIPETTKPKETEPEIVEPEETDPVIEEPEETDPEIVEPEDTEPEIEEPEDTVPDTETTEPENAEPEETEPEVFKPWFLNVFLSDSSVKEGEKVIVTVVTSADVESLTVNGREVKKYIESGWWIKTRTWIITVKASEAGQMNIDVVAYNDEGVPCGIVTETVQVREKKPDPWGKFFGWIFD